MARGRKYCSSEVESLPSSKNKYHMSSFAKAGKHIAPIVAAVIALAAFGFPVHEAQAAPKTPADKFVRTANYYLKAGTDIQPEHYQQLAAYDLLVLPAEAQVYNRGLFKKLRELNPSIVILAYVPSKSYNYGWTDELHQKLRAGINDGWWLLDPAGNPVSVWNNTAVLNGATPWNSYLPRFVHDEIWSTGLWDGVFYDEFSANVSWVNGGNIDIHRAGTRSDPSLADTAWKRGMVNILKNTRDLLGADAVIVTNGDSTDELQPYVNGRMFESFPTPWEAGGTWPGVMSNYLRLAGVVGYPPVFIVNANTGNTGENADYRKVRYSLCSTLLGDGYFAFDFGEADHGQLWRYDEEEARLGRPLGGPVNILAPAKKNPAAGIWRRDFQNGVVLINTTAKAQTIDLNEDLEKLRGTQAPDVNDGSIVSAVTLQPDDGLILLKPIAKIFGSAFPNGAYARIFDAQGAKVRNGFFAYVPPFAGDAAVALMDMNGDGVPDKVVADKGQVTVYADNGDQLAAFQPFGESYKGGVSLAFGDVDGDKQTEMITGGGSGAPPKVRVFKSDGTPLGTEFLAYDSRFRGGVSVAAGDMNGDGKAEIVVGAGPGGGPHVRVFNRYGRSLYAGFFAYDSRFRGGVNVAVGDVNGDGATEIVTGPGPGGGPHVRVFNRYGRPVTPGFFAADPASRNGARVATADIDGDGKMEIATLTTDVFQFSLTNK